MKEKYTDIRIGGYPTGTDTFNLNQPKSLACFEYATNTIRFDNWENERNRDWVNLLDVFEHVLRALHHEMLHQAIYEVAGKPTAHVTHNLNLKYRKEIWELV